MSDEGKVFPSLSREQTCSSEVSLPNPSPTPRISDEDFSKPGPSQKSLSSPEVVRAVLIETIESAILRSERIRTQRILPNSLIAALGGVFINRDLLNESTNEAPTTSRFCRICHEADSIEQYISPCWCKGSLSSVHRSCLERWLAESDSSHCELCSYVYVTKRDPRHRLLTSIIFYLRSPDTRRQTRTLVMDILICSATFPMASIGTYMGVLVADGINNPNALLPSDVPMTLANKLMAIFLLTVMTTMDFAYVSWILYRLQYHISQWYSWYRRNSKVTLVYSLENEVENE
jgi:E3 ubiquitin-protein ligase MARCH3